jgi:hypothetical protein
MDVEKLHVVLQQSFSADAAVRQPAEDTIRNLKNLPGVVQLLLQVIAEKQVSLVNMYSTTCWLQRVLVKSLNITTRTNISNV